MSDAHEVQRLAFAKYLLTLGRAQARLPEPTAAVSTLLLHDAVELLLQLMAEHLSVGAADVKFMAYFERIDPKLAPAKLPRKEAIRRLNICRRDLKHGGVLPSRAQVEEASFEAQGFFEDTLPLVFSIGFDSVTLASLVHSEQVREELRKAESLLAAADYRPATERAAAAFAHLMRAQGLPRNLDMSLRTPGELLNVGGRDPDVRSFFESLLRTISDLQTRVDLVEAGVDLGRLAVFHRLTPHVDHALSGKEYVTWQYGLQSTRDTAQFCFDFVIEAALAFQRGAPPSHLVEDAWRRPEAKS